jgi:WD40 repeat protein
MIGVPARPPYPGPRPFSVEEADLFFGRIIEARDLAGLILSYPVTVLYSQSGAGKSSLVRAGVCPRLAKRVCGIVSTRVAPVDLAVEGDRDATNVFEAAALERATSLLQGQALRTPSTWDDVCGSGPDDRLRVLIVDQMEELFLARPDRWSDREPFLRRLATIVGARSNLRLLLVIREDQIASLDSFADLFPDRLGIRFRLEPLRPDAALEAIEGPLRSSALKLANGVAEEIVTSLRRVRAPRSKEGTDFLAQFVEPVHLQVVCERLWRQSGATSLLITKDDLDLYADVDETLAEYYDERVREAAARANEREGVLRRWVEDFLITSTGRRNAVHEADLLEGPIVVGAVEHLVTLHLVRAEVRGDSRWFELAHDRLIEPVRRANDRWRTAIAGTARVGQELENRALLWARSGRKVEDLLATPELDRAEAWIHSDSARELGVSQDLQSLLMTSRTVQNERDAQAREREQSTARELAAQRTSAKRLRMVLLVTTLFLALASVSAFSYWRTTASLQEQTALADYQRLILEAARIARQDPRDGLAKIETAMALPLRSDVASPEPELRAIVRTVSPHALGELRGHQGVINTMNMSADGETVLTATSKGQIVLWDWRTSDKARIVQAEGAPSRAEFGAGSRWFAVGDNTGVVRVFTRDSLREVSRVASGSAVYDLAASPVFERLAAGLADGTMLLWPEVGQTEIRVRAHSGTVTQVTFSPNGQLVASAGSDGWVKIWNAATGELVRDLPANPQPGSPRPRRTLTLRFSTDGVFLAAAGQDRRARVWEVSSGNLQSDISHSGGSIFAVDIARHSSDYHLLSAGYGSELRVSRVGSNDSRPLGNHEGSVNSALFTPDARRIVAGGADGRAVVWDVTGSDAVPIQSLEHGAEVTAVRLSADANVLSTASMDGAVRIWDFAGMLEVPTRAPERNPVWSKRLPRARSFDEAPQGPIHGIVFDPATSQLAMGLEDGTVRLWEVYEDRAAWSFKELEVLGDLRAPARALAFGAKGKLLAIATGRDLYVWQPRTGRQRLLGLVGSHEDAINSVAFDEAGERLITTSDDGTARIWPVPNVQEQLTRGIRRMRPVDWANIIEPLQPPEAKVLVLRHDPQDAQVRLLSAAFSTDGTRVITGGSDFVARVWRVTGGRAEQLHLLRQAGEVLTATFAQGGELAVTGGADTAVRVWRLSTDASAGTEIVAEFDGHQGSVRALAVDGRFVATGTGDPERVVRIWSMSTNELLAEYRGATDDVSGVALNPVRRLVIASSYDGNIRAYNFHFGAGALALREIARERLNRVRRVDLRAQSSTH